MTSGDGEAALGNELLRGGLSPKISSPIAGYRRVVETFGLLQPSAYQAWLQNVKDKWGQRFPALATDITKIIDVKD